MNYHHAMIIAAALAFASCGGNRNKATEPLADTGRTVRTENLLASLKQLSQEGNYMFGHHDDTVYGIGWVGDSARSDVQSVCGDKPAVLSFDLGHLELGNTENLDGVPFERIRQEAIAHFDKGGMVTMSWHLDNPLSGSSSWVSDSLKEVERNTVASVLDGGDRHELFLGWLDRIADFMNSLVTPYGVKVPVLFRPWHEHSGSWFWWGQDLCTADQYKALWRMTAVRLKERGVQNVLYAYSPNSMGNATKETFMERYPGDDIIDLIGLDQYCFSEEGDTAAITRYAADLDNNLSMICDIAAEHGKAVALTETGFESLKANDWWTQTLAPVLARHPISYVLVWRNAHDKPGHFYAPYPGHPSVADFVRFYNDPKTLFLKDVNGLYIKP
jgi:mannan endo-1,4-beta-mannosidase